MDELQFSYLGQEEHEEEYDDFHDDDEENIQNGRRYRGKDLDWRLQTSFENVEEYKNSNIFQDLKENFTLRKRRELQFSSVALHPIQEHFSAAWSFSAATRMQKPGVKFTNISILSTFIRSSECQMVLKRLHEEPWTFLLIVKKKIAKNQSG